MSAVVDVVADEVLADAHVVAAAEGVAAAELVRVLESGDDDGEAVVLRAPGVRLVLQGHEVGPGDDEAVGAHGVLQTLAGDVSL